MNALTPEYAEQILQKISALPSDESLEQIAHTAARLRAQNFQPVMLVDVPGFLEITRDRLVAFIKDLVESTPDLTQQHMDLLLYQFRLLQRLRRDEPEAWDEINELMDDD
jgi:hypothetical protein